MPINQEKFSQFQNSPNIFYESIRHKYQTIIIGGGIAGMTAALQLYKFGIRVLIIEKEDNLGGHLNKWYKLFPGFVNADEVVSNIVSK